MKKKGCYWALLALISAFVKLSIQSQLSSYEDMYKALRSQVVHLPLREFYDNNSMKVEGPWAHQKPDDTLTIAVLDSQAFLQ